MKLSIIVPVYYNEDNLAPLYEDLKEKVLSVPDYDYELLFVDDGSGDGSWEVLKSLKKRDGRIRLVSLSRNFGSHAAVLCGLSSCTGDCAVIKAADMQEPAELILRMAASWKAGNQAVLAVREGREEGIFQRMSAGLYYWMVRRTALPGMPRGGFDVYLLDRRVIDVLAGLQEKNSALTGQVLWSGFKTDTVYYTRLSRKAGRSRWTLKKKIRLAMDTLFSFSTLPVSLVLAVGTCSFAGAVVWAAVVLASKLAGSIAVSGWTTLFIFNLFSFGVVMLTLGILGEYLWRTFDASRNRPPYIIAYRDGEDEGGAESEAQGIEGKRCAGDAGMDE